MSHLIVHGGRPLRGRVSPSANKNAVLPVLCATLLTREPVTLHRVPDITDVRKLLGFFRELGSWVDMDFATGTLRLQHSDGIRDHGVRLPGGMRSSVMLVPALLHRFGRARLVDDVTGCTLGVREIDPHIDVFLAFGAEVRLERGATAVEADRPLAASDHWLDYASVTTRRTSSSAPPSPAATHGSSMPPASRTCRSSAPSSAGWARASPAAAARASRSKASRRSVAPNTPSRTTSTRSRPSWR